MSSFVEGAGARVTRVVCRARSTPACMQHLIAPISCCLQAKPTNISRHHCQPLVLFLLISHYTKHFTPNPPSRKHTLPHALYLPPSTIHHRPDPRLPVPDTSSCDSTTARLTTPTLPLQPITSISPICQPPAVLTRRSTSLRLHSPPPHTSYQPSHLSNRPSSVSGSTAAAAATSHRDITLPYTKR